jgi:hypothetical protein
MLTAEKGGSMAAAAAAGSAVVAGFVLAVVAAPVLLLSHDAASAQVDGIPAPYGGLVEAAASRCPGLPASVLAAQLQAESGFDPSAVSPAGAQGVAQFMPGTWAAWGVDGDGDGAASPFEPADAVPAQGALMCQLLGRARASGLPGEPVRLALAGYNAGWGAVLAHGGVPPFPETRHYVQRVLQLAATYAAPARLVASSAPVGSLPRANPHGVDEAIRFAVAASRGPDVWYRRCLNFTAQAYGWSHAGTPYAQDHLLVAMPPELRHLGDRNPPPGALVFWATGSRAGHVALYLGNGLIASNDIERPGAISIVSFSAVEQRWGARYLGWSPPYFPAGG